MLYYHITMAMLRTNNKVPGVQHADHHETNITELELLETTLIELECGDNNFETASNIAQVKQRIHAIRFGTPVIMKGDK